MPSTDAPTRGLTHRTVVGFLWTAWGKGALAVLQMLVLAVLARLLSPADFGVVSVSLVVIGFSSIFTQVGLGPAIVQRRELEPRHIETAVVVSVLFGTGLAALIWLLAPVAAAFFRDPQVTPVLRALAWLFPIQGLQVVPESLQRRALHFRWLAQRDVAAYALGYGLVGITAALAGWGVWALVAGQIAQALLRAGILLASYPPRIRHLPEWRAFVELMYFGGGFTIAKVANQLAVQGDNLVVGRTLGSAALGLYGRAYQLMAMPATGFGTILDNVLFPTMAMVQDDPQRLAAAYRRGVALIAFVILPISVALVILAPEFIHIVLGPRWSEVVLPFQILAVGMLFRTSYKMSDSICRATGAVYRRAARQIVYAMLVIGGAWVGQRWGIAGVAYGVLFALTINFLLMAQLSLSVARMTWWSLWRAHVPALMLTAALVPVLWGAAVLLRRWALSPVVTVIATLGVGLIWSLAVAWCVPHLLVGRDVLWLLKALRSFNPKRPRPAELSRAPAGRL